jgi:alpha-beta hydrolase superfamily lysophospholipase
MVWKRSSAHTPASNKKQPEGAMIRRFILSATMLVAWAAAAAAQASLPRADGAETPIKRYGSQSGCGPTMVISHGFGGDENGNGHLAASMAMQGWRVIVMGHRESGRVQFWQSMFNGNPQNSMLRAARDPEAHRARFGDLDAVVTHVTRACRPSLFVLAGHSMGAMTTMLEAGARASFGRYGSNRFDAYVAISPQGVGTGFSQGSWLGVTRPVLMITGTQDQAAEGNPLTRLAAFEGLPAGRKRLAIIPDATHMQLGANNADPVGRSVAALTAEFLAGLAAGGRLPPSTAQGIDVRDK